MNTPKSPSCSPAATLLSRRSFLKTAITLGATVAAVYVGVLSLSDVAHSPQSDHSGPVAAKYRYNRDGRLASVTYPDGAHIEYHYAQGRVAQVVHRASEHGHVVSLRNVA